MGPGLDGWWDRRRQAANGVHRADFHIAGLAVLAGPNRRSMSGRRGDISSGDTTLREQCRDFFYFLDKAV
jgi:hypothetical protein